VAVIGGLQHTSVECGSRPAACSALLREAQWRVTHASKRQRYTQNDHGCYIGIRAMVLLGFPTVALDHHQ
jgi:hypothetical protein